MKTWTATTTTVDAPREAVLDVLTDPGACARWAPVDFEVSDLAADRDRLQLRAGALHDALDRIGREACTTRFAVA